MDVDKLRPHVTTMPIGIGDAVGMEKSQWYAAIVSNNSEKKISKSLNREDVENYVPIQREMRLRKDGKKVTVDRVVIPSVVFIHCTETQRRVIVRLPYIKRFMTNKAGGSNKGSSYPLAIIPDDQISRLQFMLGKSEAPVTFTGSVYKTGDKVKVTRGCLAGLEGEVLTLRPGKTELMVNLSHFGCVRVTIDEGDVEPLTKMN